MVSIIQRIIDGIANFLVVLSVILQKKKVVIKKRELDGIEFAVAKVQSPYGPFLPVLPISGGAAPRINPSRVILKTGTVKAPGYKPLEADMILETDVKIGMRDGVYIYADVYRPVDEQTKCPIILVWSPYGKHLNFGTMLRMAPGYMGLNKSSVSGYEDFEAPDPGFFVPRGYAVVNVDIRGSWRSEGDFYFWGKQEAVDGYDTIEYLAGLPWCNGKVGLGGNSWLAISQWFIAAENPPHLAAIAPFEGLTDAYRDQHRRGGIASSDMPSLLPLIVPSLGMMEDAGYMAIANPVWNEYWEDKKADLSKITVPAYVVASYTSKVHVTGTIRGYRNISSQEKWLRVHPYQEWYDLITNQDDLARFYDYYLKGIQNDWPTTPKVRCSLLRLNGLPIVNKIMDSYPPKSLRRKYYLNAQSMTLTEDVAKQPASCSYPADKDGEVHFDITFRSPTTLAGFPTVRLYMHCKQHDDLDVFILIRKLNKQGATMEQVNFPTSIPQKDMPKINPALHQGPMGRLRASHRAIKSSKETAPGEVYHPHDSEEKITPGTIVTLEFNAWPIGMVYEAGEGLRLSVSGREMTYVEDKGLPKTPNLNRGTHVIHTGGKHESWIELPFIDLD